MIRCSLKPLVSATLGLLLAGCAEGLSTPAPSQRDLRVVAPEGPTGVMVQSSAEPPHETHSRRQHTVKVKTSAGAGEQVLTDEALEVAALDSTRVAFVDAAGLHLHVRGERRFVGPAAPIGLAASEAGILHAISARSGAGTGLALAQWDGTSRVLLPAIEELPGPTGYFHPIFSPDLKSAFVRSSLTPRPSVVRVDLQSGEHTTLAANVPSAANEWSFIDGRLAWISGEGEQIRLDPVTGKVEVLR